jgi:hypothetical protein
MASGGVYGDYLENGWENYSWTNVNMLCKSPVHGGQYSISSTVGKTYSALFFHNHNYSPTGYKALSFWISGGPKGCYNLTVEGVIAASTPIGDRFPIDALPPNKWLHEEIPLTTLKMDDTPGCTGFWIQDQTGKTGQTFYVDDVKFVKS